MPLSARGSDELRAVAITVNSLERDVRRAVDRSTRSELTPIWRDEVREHLPGGIAGQVLGTGVRVKAGNPPQLIAAAGKRRVGRGLVPDQHWAGFEYGANQQDYSRYERRSRRGGTHTVERRTMRHLPARRRQGRHLEAAAAAAGPRVLALWTQIIIRTVMDTLEGKG